MTKAHKKILPTPEVSGSDMNVFAREPWIEGRCGHWPPVCVLPELPGWLSSQSRERLEYMEKKKLDPGGNVEFFRRLCALEHAQTPQGRLVMVAMMACMGWDDVVDDLIRDGAPVKLSLPMRSWTWLDQGPRPFSRPARQAPVEEVYHANALALAVSSVIPSSAAAPLHAGRAASLEKIHASGCDPNDMHGPLVRELVETGKLGRLVVKMGLKAGTDARGEPFLERLLSPDITLAQNQRNLMLTQLIGSGMPAHPPGCKPLLEYISQSVFGINALKVAITHPDRQAIGQQALEFEDALRARARSRRATPTPEEIERINLVDKLVASAKMEVNTPVASSASSHRMRL